MRCKLQGAEGGLISYFISMGWGWVGYWLQEALCVDDEQRHFLKSKVMKNGNKNAKSVW